MLLRSLFSISLFSPKIHSIYAYGLSLSCMCSYLFIHVFIPYFFMFPSHQKDSSDIMVLSHLHNYQKDLSGRLCFYFYFFSWLQLCPVLFFCLELWIDQGGLRHYGPKETMFVHKQTNEMESSYQLQPQPQSHINMSPLPPQSQI